MRYKGGLLISVCVIILSFIFLAIPLFANNPPDQNHSSLSVNSSVPADGQTTAILTITLHDSSGNPVVGDSVTLSDPNNSGATVTTISGTSDGSGHAIFSIKSTKVQTDNLNVTDTTSNTTFSNLGQITFTTPQPAGCNDSAPGSTPQFTSAVTKDLSQIVLTWTDAANPVTRYLISYGIASGHYIYGNPNVGPQTTTSYTVGSLSPGTRYFFVVQAINGCTPGNFSSEISASTGGGAIVVTPTSIQTHTITTSSNSNSQNYNAPTNIPVQNNIDQASPTLSTAAPSPTPFQAATTGISKEKILLYVLIGLLFTLGIVCFLYWRYVKSLKNHINSAEEDHPISLSTEQELKS